VGSGQTNINTQEQSENHSHKANDLLNFDGESEVKRDIILDIPIDMDVLSLSIKAMNKLISFFNPTNSTFDTGNNPIYQFKKAESPLSIQIIPNVNRIRIEKARAVSAIQERKCSLQELIEEWKQQKSDEELYAAEEIEPISYYRENIFNLEDYYLYRAVMKFYHEDYKEAIKDFKTWSRLKSLFKANNNKHKSENKSSHVSSQTDLSDIGLWSFNSYETSYNILLCYLCSGDARNALELVTKLIDTIPSKYKSKLYLIRGLLYQEKEDFEKWKKDFIKSYTNDPQLSAEWLDLDKEWLIEPFDTKNRLWAKFPHRKFKIGLTSIYSRPSFSIPFIKPPNMIPNVDEDQMKRELNLTHLGGIKPEAPWIKRCGFGIKFTDEIQETDFKIEPESSKNIDDGK
jgi:tetratricopeptide (TPR) repeat protein